MQLQGVGMGVTPATSSATPSTNTVASYTFGGGLQTWTNPLVALQDIPGAVQLLGISGYQSYAIGILAPIAALVGLLIFTGGRRR